MKNPHASPFPRFAKLGRIVARPTLGLYSHLRGLHHSSSAVARSTGRALRERLTSGESVFVVGICTGAHDTGACLFEFSTDGSSRIHSNYEEDRLLGVRNSMGLPLRSLREVNHDLTLLGSSLHGVHAVLVTYDYSDLLSRAVEFFCGEAAANLAILADPLYRAEAKAILAGLTTRKQLEQEMGLPAHVPVIGVPHHDAHAWLSYAASPFASSNDSTLIGVVDAMGDLAAISFYIGREGGIEKIYDNGSHWDSLGHFYAAMTSALGGWPMGEGEGRFMGASAWGSRSREQNRYYSKLRDIFELGENGQIHLNRDLANWQCRGSSKPFKPALVEILGQPIHPNEFWSPAKALDFEPHEVDVALRDRLDKIAAVQLVFEDALIHVIEYFVQKTGSSKLVLTGGASLNCIANHEVLNAMDASYFEENLGRADTTLELWVPPIPGDAGVQIGAAYAFGVKSGAPLSNPLTSPYCSGRAPTVSDISQWSADASVGVLELTESSSVNEREELADLIARLISSSLLVGIYQGRGELGLRALGNRSILANPRGREVRDVLNRRVKHREVFRPFAPMATLEAAREWFDLPSGVSAGDYDALTYMGITVNAKPKALRIIPAVLNRDGTARLQLVRPTDNPLAYDVLKSLGKRNGIAIALNTSLNVQTPMVGSVEQAVGALKRSSGLDGVIVVAEEGPAFVLWHNVVGEFKDAGSRLLEEVKKWRTATGAA